ncbi:MAG: YceI family protein [Bacteroidia bacterium]|jgi:polyisoprenoid-binding protein YceI|nr:YceI family protein [Bacteroidia bacterium]
MQKTLILLAVLVVSVQTSIAQIYKAKDGSTNITFFSTSPLEDITATNKGAIIVYNSSTNDIQIRVSVINFKFKNGLMEEHFNDNYMETEKFPNAIFKGKINEAIDMAKDGETKVTVTGKMEMHGVTKDETFSGTVTRSGNEIMIKTKFKIKLVDYSIKVPSLYVKNIAEIIDVDVVSTLEPFQKK